MGKMLSWLGVCVSLLLSVILLLSAIEPVDEHEPAACEPHAMRACVPGSVAVPSCPDLLAIVPGVSGPGAVSWPAYLGD